MNNELRIKFQKREEIIKIWKILHEYNYENKVILKKKVEGYYTVDLNTINVSEIKNSNDLIKASDKYIERNKEAPIELANHIKWRYSGDYRRELNNGVSEEEIKVKNKYDGFSFAKSAAIRNRFWKSLDGIKLYTIVTKYK